ncbi:MAG: hypothetical protein QM607_07250 [Microbacterium sp.]
MTPKISTTCGSDETTTVEADEIVIFDATFLQRGSLRDLWDEVIYLHAEEPVALLRGVERDASALGGRASAQVTYSDRYMAACRIYSAEENPMDRASIVIDNTDLDNPHILRMLNA